MNLFVYGTLLKGLCRFRVISGSAFLGHAFIKADLYDLGSFPAVAEGGGVVYGELYSIDERTLHDIDSIEGFRPDRPETSFYQRQKIAATSLHDGSTIQAETYFFNQELSRDKKIDCGDYRRYLIEGKVSGSGGEKHNTGLRQDRMWYIAYGSNMCTERLKKRIGDFFDLKTGYFEGYRLIFNKLSTDRKQVYANITPGGREQNCPFAAYLVTPEQLLMLDDCEGVAYNNYVRIGLPFTDKSGAEYSGQIYMAHPDKLVAPDKPQAHYLGFIQRGYQEHGFDLKYLSS
jgi:gamma-glutamylcyclotransferase (GGCT)/AIG2-like uncharacterized protein YtfP